MTGWILLVVLVVQSDKLKALVHLCLPVGCPSQDGFVFSLGFSFTPLHLNLASSVVLIM